MLVCLLWAYTILFICLACSKTLATELVQKAGVPEAVAGIDVVTLYRRTDDDVLGIVFSGMLCVYAF